MRSGAAGKGRRAPSPMAQPKRRSPCPVACTLDLVGDRWSLLVVRDLYTGKSTYKQLLASPEGIATNILAERLKRLVRAGLVEKRAAEGHAGRSSYGLTERGLELVPILEQLRDFGLRNLPGTEARIGR
jgi:DNA-binding HxlR family transcriptional regulator